MNGISNAEIATMVDLEFFAAHLHALPDTAKTAETAVLLIATERLIADTKAVGLVVSYATWANYIDRAQAEAKAAAMRPV